MGIRNKYVSPTKKKYLKYFSYVPAKNMAVKENIGMSPMNVHINNLENRLILNFVAAFVLLG